MAGQHLLDQRRAGARQAEDENGPASFQSGAGPPGEILGVEHLNHLIDEASVLLRRVLATPAIQFKNQGVRLGAHSAAFAYSPRIENMCQGKQQAASRASYQIRVCGAQFQVPQGPRLEVCRVAALPGGHVASGGPAAAGEQLERQPRPRSGHRALRADHPDSNAQWLHSAATGARLDLVHLLRRVVLPPAAPNPMRPSMEYGRPPGLMRLPIRNRPSMVVHIAVKLGQILTKIRVIGLKLHGPASATEAHFQIALRSAKPGRGARA